MVLFRSRSIRKNSKWDRKGRLTLLLFLFALFLTFLRLFGSDEIETETDPMTHRGVQDIIKDKGIIFCSFFEVIEVKKYFQFMETVNYLINQGMP